MKVFIFKLVQYVPSDDPVVSAMLTAIQTNVFYTIPRIVELTNKTLQSQNLPATSATVLKDMCVSLSRLQLMQQDIIEDLAGVYSAPSPYSVPSEDIQTGRTYL